MAKKKQKQQPRQQEAGWEFYHFDPVEMDASLNTNAFQQAGNWVLKREIERDE